MCFSEESVSLRVEATRTVAHIAIDAFELIASQLQTLRTSLCCSNALALINTVSALSSEEMQWVTSPHTSVILRLDSESTRVCAANETNDSQSQSFIARCIWQINTLGLTFTSAMIG